LIWAVPVSAPSEPQDPLAFVPHLSRQRPGGVKNPTEVVSRILGHRHVATTQAIYQHAVPALEEKAISRFAELLERAQSA
jgi:hypothetical protein